MREDLADLGRSAHRAASAWLAVLGPRDICHCRVPRSPRYQIMRQGGGQMHRRCCLASLGSGATPSLRPLADSLSFFLLRLRDRKDEGRGDPRSEVQFLDS